MENNKIEVEKIFKDILDSREQLEANIEDSKNFSYDERSEAYMKYVQSHNVKKLEVKNDTRK